MSTEPSTKPSGNRHGAIKLPNTGGSNRKSVLVGLGCTKFTGHSLYGPKPFGPRHSGKREKGEVKVTIFFRVGKARKRTPRNMAKGGKNWESVLVKKTSPGKQRGL